MLNIYLYYLSVLIYKSERRDLNPRPPLPQSGALPSCATPRKIRLNFEKILANIQAYQAN